MTEPQQSKPNEEDGKNCYGDERVYVEAELLIAVATALLMSHSGKLSGYSARPELTTGAAGAAARRDVDNMSRRLVLRNSLAMAAAGTLARPYIADAAATTASVWWVQGFAPEEDVSFKKIVADYQKITGNTIDYSIFPYAPMRQKIVSAITSAAVPDLFQNNPAEIIALYAWQDKLMDVSDVVDTQRGEYTETALLRTASASHNSVASGSG